MGRKQWTLKLRNVWTPLGKFGHVCGGPGYALKRRNMPNPGHRRGPYNHHHSEIDNHLATMQCYYMHSGTLCFGALSRTSERIKICVPAGQQPSSNAQTHTRERFGHFYAFIGVKVLVATDFMRLIRHRCTIGLARQSTRMEHDSVGRSTVCVPSVAHSTTTSRLHRWSITAPADMGLGRGDTFPRQSREVPRNPGQAEAAHHRRLAYQT